jgi:hypothetical protein
LFVIALVLAYAQAPAAAAKPDVTITQRKLDVMSDACGAPRKWLTHMGGNEVRFRPSRNGSLKRVDCVLNKMQSSRLPMTLGFVGNEAPANETDH